MFMRFYANLTTGLSEPLARLDTKRVIAVAEPKAAEQAEAEARMMESQGTNFAHWLIHHAHPSFVAGLYGTLTEILGAYEALAETTLEGYLEEE